MDSLADLVEEANRQFTICNACRYCEGYCAVFPAMELQTAFEQGDISYLANLCHDCRGCHQACMYTDPHEFAINIPALMSSARVASYESYARPRFMVFLLRRSAAVLAAATLICVGLVIALYLLIGSSSLWGTTAGPDSLYRVVSHEAMTIPALLLSVFDLALLVWALAVFQAGGAIDRAALRSPSAWASAVRDAASLRWLRGGGGDCYFPREERPSPLRRRLHHLVAYGFLTTFAATVSAAVMEYLLGELPPYDFLSVPVLLGTVGGVAVSAGGAAFLWLNSRDAPELSAGQSRSLDQAFLVVLIVVSITGIALMIVQQGSGFPHTLLLVHLATVLAFFCLLPYTKLVHAVYRFGALLRWARDRPSAEPRES